MNIKDLYEAEIKRAHPYLRNIEIEDVQSGYIKATALARSQRGDWEDCVRFSISVDDATHGNWEAMQVTYD